MSFPQTLNSKFAELMRNPAFQKLVVKEAESTDDDDAILTRAFDETYPAWMQDFENRAEFVGDSVVVYRGISADTVEDLDLNNVGVYWTWDRDKAANYSNENTKKNLFVIKATAGINDIHLKDTLKKIVWDGYTHEESERELQIKKKAKLNLIEIIGPDKTYPMKSKTATASIIAALKSVVAEPTITKEQLEWLEDWVGSHRSFDKLLNTEFPKQFRESPDLVYRGMTLSKADLDAFKKGKPLSVKGSWSTREEPAEYFAEADYVDGDRELGILLYYSPSEKDIVVNVASVVEWVADNYSEEEIEESYESLDVHERGHFEGELILKPVKIEAKYSLDKIWDIEEQKWTEYE